MAQTGGRRGNPDTSGNPTEAAPDRSNFPNTSGTPRTSIPQPPPAANPRRPQDNPTIERPDSGRVSGTVTMENGTPPPEPVRIDRVCGGRAVILAYTDSKGGFSGGATPRLYSDARGTDARNPRTGTFGGAATQTPGPCSLRAFLPGYGSSEVDLSLVASYEPVLIVLHALAGVEGRTVSATTLEAPKDARSAFEKGSKAMEQHKWEQALPQLEKAVRLYPRYAVAWSALGKVHREAQRTEEARRAWRTAVSIDAKFIDPYFGLAELAMHEQKWAEMAEYTGALVKLDPFDFPGAWAYDAMAHLNLNHLDDAEKSARAGLRVDTLGQVPKNEHLLGVVLMRRGDYENAMAHLNKYLEAAPDAPDAEFVQRQAAACASRAYRARAASPANQFTGKP